RSDDEPRLAVSVDAKSNSLIVAAPDPLFQEVKQLVEQLDVMASEQKDTIRVVTLHDTGPEAVRQALAAMVGPAVRFGNVPANAQTGGLGAAGGALSDRPWMRRQQSSFGSPQAGPQPWQPPAYSQPQTGAGYGGRSRGNYYNPQPQGSYAPQPQPAMVPFQPGRVPPGGMQPGGASPGRASMFPGSSFRGGAPSTSGRTQQ
ncbi:MAG: hypothetical protein ABR915_22910, partial [Thermoguttaceae bacterium]